MAGIAVVIHAMPFCFGTKDDIGTLASAFESSKKGKRSWAAMKLILEKIGLLF
jgi:hypothetical protein